MLRPTVSGFSLQNEDPLDFQEQSNNCGSLIPMLAGSQLLMNEHENTILRVKPVDMRKKYPKFNLITVDITNYINIMDILYCSEYPYSQ